MAYLLDAKGNILEGIAISAADAVLIPVLIAQAQGDSPDYLPERVAKVIVLGIFGKYLLTPRDATIVDKSRGVTTIRDEVLVARDRDSYNAGFEAGGDFQRAQAKTARLIGIPAEAHASPSEFAANAAHLAGLSEVVVPTDPCCTCNHPLSAHQDPQVGDDTRRRCVIDGCACIEFAYDDMSF